MEEKKPFFTVSRFVCALVCFGAFLVVGIGGYYVTVGMFVSADLAALYAALALVGALAVLLRLNRFALLYYVGCALGWGVGWFISGLKGDFAPTAGNICAFFLIAVFALLGCIAQWKGFQKRRARKKEAQAKAEAEAERDRARAELDAARQARQEAERALLEAGAAPQAGAAPLAGAAPGAETQVETEEKPPEGTPPEACEAGQESAQG